MFQKKIKASKLLALLLIINMQTFANELFEGQSGEIISIPAAIQKQADGLTFKTPEGIKQLEDLGATEVIVAFRNTYEGGPDERTLEGMIAEINWYAEEVINKSK